MPNLLDIHRATVYRGPTRVFEDLSLSIAPGCHTAILGPNGAGKTTLLMLLAREIYPVRREGSYVRIHDRERWNVEELRRRFGIVSHDLQQGCLGHARGWQVILSGYTTGISTWPHQRFSDEQRARADRVMEQLGVFHLRDRAFATLSTGEQRRFLLGRALVRDPETLVLDEPTGGLDLKTCFHYLDTIRTLMRAGKTLILVTHHLHEIPPEVERVVLLKEGRVVADGGKARILTDQALSDLYDTPVRLVRANGFYQALPG